MPEASEEKGLRGFLGRMSRGSPRIGTTDRPTSSAEVASALDALGDAGEQARALDEAVEVRCRGEAGLSELTSDLALQYLERIRHPIPSLTLEAGVTLVSRGYAAHRAVEGAPATYGSGSEIPVLGTLPDLRRGRPPQDLLTRVVKATRRPFPSIRAVPEPVWDGFVVAVTRRTQAGGPQTSGDDGDRVLDRSVVEGLLRFGWVLRQVDLRYAQPAGESAPGDAD